MRPYIFSLLMVLFLAACSAPSTLSQTNDATGDTADAGTIVDPPVELSDFSLPSNQGGQEISLSDLRGHPILLFFGYTFCPDVCPTTLSEFKRTKDLLGEQAEDVRFVFISVDSERDKPEVLAKYIGAFDPNFIGLQGDEATFRRIGKEYGLYYQKRTVEGSSAGYLMDHSAASYLIDAEGRLRTIYGYATPPTVLKDGLQGLLNEG